MNRRRSSSRMNEGAPHSGVLRLLALGLPLLLCSLDARAAQVCATQTVGNQEFRGISGSSDVNVIAVGKKGTIVRYDGAAWTAMASGSNEDLNDVEVAGLTAFVVGKDGETLQLLGGGWISRSGFTNEDLFGVWAASATEAYVAGKNGTLFKYDGSNWVNQRTAAGTGSDDLVDVWGDANRVYVVSSKGDLYRYNRLTGTWLPPDTACTIGDGFEDLWGDLSGNLYLVGSKHVYRHDGTSCVQIATAGDDLRGVYGWSLDGDVYAVGKKGVVFHYDGSSWTETQEGKDELQDDWVSPTGNAYYAGKKDELTVCQCTDCPAVGLAKFVLNHDAYGINCQNETVRVDVVDVLTGTPVIAYNQRVTLDTQTGFGTWVLTSGGGSFLDATPNDGLATYDWPLGQSFAVFELRYTEGPGTFDIDVYQTSNPLVRDDDSEGNIGFAPSGFTLTAAPLANPPGPITPFATSQIAGSDFGLYLAAFGQTPSDPVCGIIEAYTGPKSLKLWFTRADPASGSVSVSIDGSAIGVVEGSAAAQPVVFANGQAAVTGKYKDVGRIRISVKDDLVPDPDLPNGIRGATANFILKPARFALSDIADGSGNPNPGAADASGPRFIAAGEPFAATVTALDAEDSITPNYGRESIAETVRLAGNLIAPPGGTNPPVTAAVGFGPFAGGQATGTDFSWPEVGIVTLTPEVDDGDYLGAGNVVGATSGNVGRFAAHHFTTSLNTPAFATGCAAGAFTYIGESFDYATAPVIVATARAAGGSAAQNYAAGFFKLSNSSLANRTYTAAAGALDTSGLPAPASDPAILPLGGGLAMLTFGSGTGLSFDRVAPQPPFDADIQLAIDVIDSDGAAALGNPISFGSPGGIGFDNGRTMRYGRVRLINAVGSELVNLSVPMRAEYFVDPSVGFVAHTADSCTGSVTLALGAFTSSLSPGDTCVLDDGSPGDSGEGCAVAGPPGQRFSEPPAGGDFNLILRASGAGNDGSTTVEADVPGWLKFDWNTALPGLENPTATGRFGIFRGENRRIYTREVY